MKEDTNALINYVQLIFNTAQNGSGLFPLLAKSYHRKFKHIAKNICTHNKYEMAILSSMDHFVKVAEVVYKIRKPQKAAL